MTTRTARLATAKQVSYLTSLIASHPGLDTAESAAQAIADGTLTAAEASEAIDALRYAPRTAKATYAPSPVPASTYPTRLAAEQSAKAEATAAHQIAKDLADALPFGRPAPEGTCMECGHRHEATCGHTVQVMSDMWDDCRCTATTPRATSEHEAAYQAACTARTADWYYHEAYRAARIIEAGDPVEVVKGRKVAVGTTGTVVRLYHSQYGMRALLDTTEGQVWVALANLAH